MTRQTIVFTAPGQAELRTEPVPALGPQDVMLETDYTVISSGTERANLMGARHTNGAIRNDENLPRFPRVLGYCGVGRVLNTGPEVTGLAQGDRAVIYFGVHTSINVVPQNNVIKIENDRLDILDAAPTVIANISLGGVRMAELEVAESVMVMGLGILGQYAVELCRLSGAYPVIAADPDETRRQEALEAGADYAVDPSREGFAEQVMAVTGGHGVNAVIEVSGAAVALDQALECTARMGRVVLLGCTRENDCATDYYHMVHFRGVRILGAHTFVRPQLDSRRGYWTYQDDCLAVLSLMAGNRFHPGRLIQEVHTPEEAPAVYTRLAKGAGFPIGVAFDWRGLHAR